MKYGSVSGLLLTAIFWVACNSHAPAVKKPMLVLKGDSGYVTKAEVLPFLLASGNADSFPIPQFNDTAGIGDYVWRELFPGDTDIIGKYYPANTFGHKMLAAVVRQSSDSSFGIRIIELNRVGEAVGSMWFQLPDRVCSGASVHCFSKIGRYFIVEDCGHGSSYGRRYGSVFDHIIPHDSLRIIEFYLYFGELMPGSPPYPRQVTGEMRTTDSNLTMHYRVEFMNDSDEANWPSVNVDLPFKWENNNWATDDSLETWIFDPEYPPSYLERLKK